MTPPDPQAPPIGQELALALPGPDELLKRGDSRFATSGLRDMLEAGSFGGGDSTNQVQVAALKATRREGRCRQGGTSRRWAAQPGRLEPILFQTPGIDGMADLSIVILV